LIRGAQITLAAGLARSTRTTVPSREQRFSVPAIFASAVERSLGQAWPQATGEAGAHGLCGYGFARSTT
jgi:hypothetical protein